MSSICRFIPSKNDNGNLKTIHFVYETEWKKMKQPFVQPIYYLYLVSRGTGTVKLVDRSFSLTAGTLFLTFPGYPYEIQGSEDLCYLYISFMGSRVGELFGQLGIGVEKPVFPNCENLLPFWKQALQRLNNQNANILTESVLLYTLSFLGNGSGEGPKTKTSSALENITRYIDDHYTDPDLSLKEVAGIFAYTDKYLSRMFKRYMHINWSIYLNRLRIQHAVKLLDSGHRDLSAIALACGYRDPVYFSKVFKKMMGYTPGNHEARRTQQAFDE